MAKADKITGEKIWETLSQAKDNNTYIEVRFPKVDEGELTVISEIRHTKEISCLVFDKPRHLTPSDNGNKNEKVEFQYNGEDNILYSFSVPYYRLFSHEMLIDFPEVIYRHQRRRAFRLDVPNGTRIVFEKNGKAHKLIVSNISLGGSFGSLIFFQKEDSDEVILNNGEKISNVELYVPTLLNSNPIHIQSAKILRRERDDLGNIQYAIQFTSIDRQEEKILTGIIYDIQRQFLKNRVQLKD